MKRVLISVSDKTGLDDFTRRLIALGYDEIVSTGGTAKKLRASGFKVADVAEITGFPECFEGRVKTLHPKIHGGILFRADKPDHVARAAELDIRRFDMVVVDLYPFLKTVAKPGVTFDDAIENIDIGGPAMIRAAAKNHPDVIVVCDPADREPVLNELEARGCLEDKTRLALAAKVYRTMSAYDGAIDQYLSAQLGQQAEHLHLVQGRLLAYAENRCQDPAWLFPGERGNPLAISQCQIAAGNPSYITLADGAQLVDILSLMTECFRRSFGGRVPYIAIAGKHGNPCGAAVDWLKPETAIAKTLRGDPIAVMGGELITNFPLTDELGSQIHLADRSEIGREYWGLDQVLAPDISPKTIEVLGKKAKRRLLINPALKHEVSARPEWRYAQLPDGDWLKQRPSPFVLSPETIQLWVGRPLKNSDFDNLIIAFACAWRATSNTVALAREQSLIGLGCGQQDRIACVRLCLERARRSHHVTADSVFASDGFFPYAEHLAGEAEITHQLSRFGALCEDLDEITSPEACLMPPEEAAAKNWAPEKEKLRLIGDFIDSFISADRREGPELLRDAGCLGGVVPADGKELEKVKNLFKEANMNVAFVAPENRGFAKH